MCVIEGEKDIAFDQFDAVAGQHPLRAVSSNYPRPGNCLETRGHGDPTGTR